MKGLLVSILAVGALAIEAAHAQAHPWSEQAGKHISWAMKYASDQNYGNVVHETTDLLEIENLTDVERSIGLYLRGEAYVKTDKPFLGRRDLEAAIGTGALPGELHRSAQINLKRLDLHLGRTAGGAVGYNFALDPGVTLQELDRSKTLLDAWNFRDTPEAGNLERIATLVRLAREYELRGARSRAAAALDQARLAATVTDSTEAKLEVLIGAYWQAEIRNDRNASKVGFDDLLKASVEQEEAEGTARILRDAIIIAESRGATAEACRHRANLDRLYEESGIDYPLLRQDRNKAVLESSICSGAR